MRYWVMRAGRGGIAKDFCIQRGLLAMDWEFGDMSHLPDDPEAFKEWYRNSEEGKNDSEDQVRRNAGTNRCFVYDVQNGDCVALSNAEDDWIYLGLVEGLYYYSPKVPKGKPDFVHRRKIKWQVAYPRKAFSKLFRASLNAEQALFNIDKHADELRAKLKS